MSDPFMLVTCEHACNRIPAQYARLFADSRELLNSHRGWDPGALEAARLLARSLGAELRAAEVSRLLVDANRSPGNPRVFSEISRGLPTAERAGLLERFHTPHWRAVRGLAEAAMAEGRPVVHVAVHSFAPVLDGEVRTADVGLLYDPRRRAEAALCGAWRQRLLQLDPTLRVRRNYPYRGRSDGLCTALRRLLPEGYAGIELELNQRFPLAGGRPWNALQAVLAVSLRAVAARPLCVVGGTPP